MRPPVLNPLFAAITSCRASARSWRSSIRAAARPRRRAAPRRSAVPPADRRDRPAGAAEAARRRARHRRHRRGDGRPAPAPPPHRSRAPYQIYASDDTGDLILTFSTRARDYLEKLLPVGERRYVSGTVALYDGMLQMVHPDRVVDEAELAKLPLIEPVYPLTEGLSLNQVRKAIDGALAQRAGACRNGRTPTGSRARSFPPFARGAAQRAPARRRPTTSCPKAPAWSRLAYRRTARRPAGAGAGARAYPPAGRPRHRRRRATCARR